MNMKKTWKQFFSLNRHHAEGFTLVELIVVIAILAILGGVAVPAYSGYVEKANRAADISLASEVAHALTLYSYSNPNPEDGYVTITKDGATASNDGMKAAMAAAFGEEWEQNDAVVLKADWSEASSSSMLNYAINNADTAQTVADSTFLNEASTDGMLDALTTLTGIVNGVINDYGDRGGDIGAKLGTLLGDDFVTNLNNTGVTSGTDEYNTVVSNMMVGYFADALHNNSGADDDLTTMVQVYASMYAYAEATNNTTAMDTINDALKNVTTDDLNPDTIINAFASDEEFLKGYDAYTTSGKGVNDFDATLEIMGALSEISNSYTDAESLSNPSLYNSEAVKAQANDYVNAIKTVAGMDEETLAALKASVGNGSVVVSLADGVVVVSPALS